MYLFALWIWNKTENSQKHTARGGKGKENSYYTSRLGSQSRQTWTQRKPEVKYLSRIFLAFSFLFFFFFCNKTKCMEISVQVWVSECACIWFCVGFPKLSLSMSLLILKIISRVCVCVCVWIFKQHRTDTGKVFESNHGRCCSYFFQRHTLFKLKYKKKPSSHVLSHFL